MKVTLDYSYIEGCQTYYLTINIYNEKMNIGKHNFFTYKINEYDLTSRYFRNYRYKKDFETFLKPYLDKKICFLLLKELSRHQLYFEFLYAFNAMGRKYQELDSIEFIVNKSGYNMNVVFDEDMEELTNIICSLIENKFLQFREVVFKHNKIKITEE